MTTPVSRAELRQAKRMFLAEQRLSRAFKEPNCAWASMRHGSMRVFWKLQEEQFEREKKAADIPPESPR